MSKKERLTSMGGQPPSDSDRRHERAAVNHEAVVTWLDPDLNPCASWGCTLRDLSAGGASLLAADMPMEGDALIVAIHPSNGRAAVALFARVIHVGMAEGEWTRIGVRFLRAPERVEASMNAAIASMSGRTQRPSRRAS